MNLRKEVPSWQERRNPRQTFLQEQITKTKAIFAATAGKKWMWSSPFHQTGKRE
jgi:hypothetical protein